MSDSFEEFLKAKRESNPLEYDEKDLNKVLRSMARLGSTYSSELSRELLIEPEKVNRILQAVIERGYVERLELDEFQPSPLIKCRFNDLWARGIRGFFMFNMMSFFVLTTKGIDKLKGENQFNKGIALNSAYIDAGVAFYEKS